MFHTRVRGSNSPDGQWQLSIFSSSGDTQKLNNCVGVHHPPRPLEAGGTHKTTGGRESKGHIERLTKRVFGSIHCPLLMRMFLSDFSSCQEMLKLPDGIVGDQYTARWNAALADCLDTPEIRLAIAALHWKGEPHRKLYCGRSFFV